MAKPDRPVFGQLHALNTRIENLEAKVEELSAKVEEMTAALGEPPAEEPAVEGAPVEGETTPP